MNILISVDEKYLDKAKTMLFSMRLHTKEPIIVYLLNHSLTPKMVLDLSSYLLKKCDIKLEEIDVKNTMLDDFPVNERLFSIETYYRILAQFILPSSLDRVLWLDADIIILNDICEFYNSEFTNDSMYIACMDRNDAGEEISRIKDNLSIPKEHKYFNAGVLLINLSRLRKTTEIKNLIADCTLIKDKIYFQDQDILNKLYTGKVTYADWKKYNHQLTVKSLIPNDERKDIVILHYSGVEKPWKYEYIYKESKYYWSVRLKQKDYKDFIFTYAKYAKYALKKGRSYLKKRFKKS